MKVLVINCGSTSLKYQLIDSVSEEVLAKGICERIGIADGKMKYQNPAKGVKVDFDFDLPDHGVAFQRVIEKLVDENIGAVASLDEIDCVGHRVVHGGEFFDKSVLVTDDVLAKIEECSDLAPLHNPANLLGIRACAKVMPNVPQTVTFDTAFHQTMPEQAYMYAVPYKYYTDYKVRRYGFHGTSHSFVSKRAAEILQEKKGIAPEDSKIIVCHLGGGASVTAVKGGKSVDTSMGLTPLDGLVMGTRSGSIDPAIVGFIAEKENKSAAEVVDILNKESGIYGLSGVSSDFRDIDAGHENGDKRCTIAYNSFCYSIIKMVGAYVAAMNGIDMIAFTAGIGENDNMVRKTILDSLTYLGITINEEANNSCHGVETELSASDSKVLVYGVPTNEELAIARDAVAIVENK